MVNKESLELVSKFAWYVLASHRINMRCRLGYAAVNFVVRTSRCGVCKQKHTKEESDRASPPHGCCGDVGG